ncbi:MAG TPA: RimK family protein [Pseudomonadales bacterium]
MSQVLLVVDRPEDWSPFYPSDQVITFDQYLQIESQLKPDQRVRVINLCKDYSYLSDGYYCSLLSEARHHHVIPSIRTLNDLSNPQLYQLQLHALSGKLDKTFRDIQPGQELLITSYFGIVSEPALQALARFLFERFPCPILQARITRNAAKWEISELSLRTQQSLNDQEQTEFANALESFSARVWAPKRQTRGARYDLAILVDPEEKLPPSDKVALKKFVQAGKKLGVDVELITSADYMRLPEFDALFIRETTAIDHHTYRFAKKAEAEGLVVMDDPTSILRCTNKIYLADLFATHKVPAPKTHILRREHPEDIDSIIESLGLPIVVKIPDGSFSRGVEKAKTRDELEQTLQGLFRQSSLLLAQEYIYTDYDWRIGVLNNKPLFACRYYMVKNHWQIYQHGSSKTASGGFDTLPTFEVPKSVLQAALKATRPIGNGFYGVDIKEKDGKAYVIEVNDNPNVDSRVEDLYLGSELYMLIMQEFVRRIEENKRGN